MDKRTFLKTAGLLTLSGLVSSNAGLANTLLSDAPTLPQSTPETTAAGSFTLPALGFATDALEPHFDKATMELHHGKHHAAYIKNLNEAVTGTPFEGLSIEDILKKVTAKDAKIRNNGGGHYNHSLFWQSLAPATGQMPTGKLLAAINAKFGSMEQFKEAFNTAAKGVFGSGWVWLLTNNKGDMWIQTTPNQDNPLMKRLVKRTGKPLLMLDVWEHAYYLKYQNKRADYIDAFWKVINWQEIAKRM